MDSESTWIIEDKRTWAEWIALRTLKIGPIPSHLALIMDGNRRFARQKHKNVLHGHTEGFKTLTNVIAWCRDIGITEVTAYAFSIENFKRSKEEVDGLMKLACDKFEQLLKETDKLAEHGVRVRVIGNLGLLPEKLAKLASKAMLATEDNKVCTLNVAMAYTSREEICTAMTECAAAISAGDLKVSDLSIDLIEHCLYTEGRNPDVLLRTSGETRLSDFLLWQCQFSYLYFIQVLWPDLSIWKVFAGVFMYQRHRTAVTEKEMPPVSARCEAWKDEVVRRRRGALRDMAGLE